jgi:hypothetical protein
MERIVEQLDHAAIRLLTVRPELFARQGAVVATWGRRRPQGDSPIFADTKTGTVSQGRCVSRSLRYGPYYCLSYRDGGRQRSVYLGREGELVETVRWRLAGLQGPRRQRQTLERFRRQTITAMRAEKRRLDVQLRGFGLRLKGFEVRGWRASPLRMPARPKPPAIRPLEPIPAANPMRRPTFRLRGPKPIRPPRFPHHKPRSMAPAATEERLWQTIAARGDNS